MLKILSVLVVVAMLTANVTAMSMGESSDKGKGADGKEFGITTQQMDTKSSFKNFGGMLKDKWKNAGCSSTEGPCKERDTNYELDEFVTDLFQEENGYVGKPSGDKVKDGQTLKIFNVKLEDMLKKQFGGDVDADMVDGFRKEFCFKNKKEDRDSHTLIEQVALGAPPCHAYADLNNDVACSVKEVKENGEDYCRDDSDDSDVPPSLQEEINGRMADRAKGKVMDLCERAGDDSAPDTGDMLAGDTFEKVYEKVKNGAQDMVRECFDDCSKEVNEFLDDPTASGFKSAQCQDFISLKDVYLKGCDDKKKRKFKAELQLKKISKGDPLDCDAATKDFASKKHCKFSIHIKGDDYEKRAQLQAAVERAVNEGQDSELPKGVKKIAGTAATKINYVNEDVVAIVYDVGREMDEENLCDDEMYGETLYPIYDHLEKLTKTEIGARRRLENNEDLHFDIEADLAIDSYDSDESDDSDDSSDSSDSSDCDPTSSCHGCDPGCGHCGEGTLWVPDHGHCIATKQGAVDACRDARKKWAFTCEAATACPNTDSYDDVTKQKMPPVRRLQTLG